MKTRTLLLSLLMLALFCNACKNDDPELQTAYLELPGQPLDYGQFNDHIPTLGRVLFYDPQLSVNNSVSCATCHKQVLAFSDNTALSKGFENRLTTRNSMPIQNLAVSSFGIPASLFWDGRENNLRQMVMRPIVNHIEMGISDPEVLARKLSVVPYYRDLFKNAYGTEEVTSAGIAEGLSSFLASITSTNTKFDRHNFQGEKLTALEEKGKALFIGTYDCNACHQVQNPSGYIFAGTFSNIGLEDNYADNGLENTTGHRSDAGKFKIPSLRNVMLTAPYMHDGRFSTLEAVMDHYSEGIEDHPNLDPRLRSATGEPLNMHIPEDDKTAIIAFLNTLTDTHMITDPKFSNPFKAR
ncbi:MAG TPA: cytochrome c peroxidase [Ohtaekwangia sp.]|nr:cytochrome c peroxidase [Ohtaekwangia sp.]